MKLQSNPGGTITRSNVGKIRSFGIKDPTIVMKTLSGLYSNIQRIIVQEYFSNARDAHREVNKEHIPIDVVLPTHIDNSLRIRDYGPGLSLERIDDVFIMFGESTKRNENNQTGGFGIGAKCGLAYNDKMFSVVSITKEHNQNIKRIYTVFLNEDEIPEMIQLNDTGEGNGELTDEECGVEISIPVNNNDFFEIRKYIINTCDYWDVRPNIKNDDIKYPEHEVIISGEDWEILNPECGSFMKSNIVIILDGIKYEIPREVFSFLTPELQQICRLQINMHFDTGEIYPAVNRENIKLNETSRNLIINRLEKINNYLKNYIRNDILNSKDLYEANVKFNTHYKNLLIKMNVQWNGFTINGKNFKSKNMIVYYYKRNDQLKNKLKTYKRYSLDYEENSIVIYNNENTKRSSINRVKTIFETYPDIESVQVIQNMDNEEMKLAKEHGLDYINYYNITDFEKKKIKRKNKSVIKKCFTLGKYSDFVNDDVDIKNDKGVYFEFVRNIAVNPHITITDLNFIEKTYNIKLIGIPTRYLTQAEKNPNMTYITEWIDEKIQEELKKIQNFTQFDKEAFFIDKYTIENLNVDNCGGWVGFFQTNYKYFPKDFPVTKLYRFEQLITKYIKRNKSRNYLPIENINRIIKYSNKNISLSLLCDEEKSNFKRLFENAEKCFQMYPLLNIIYYYDIHHNEDKIEMIVEYIKKNN